jgi:hypothetical protein
MQPEDPYRTSANRRRLDELANRQSKQELETAKMQLQMSQMNDGINFIKQLLINQQDQNRSPHRGRTPLNGNSQVPEPADRHTSRRSTFGFSALQDRIREQRQNLKNARDHLEEFRSRPMDDPPPELPSSGQEPEPDPSPPSSGDNYHRRYGGDRLKVSQIGYFSPDWPDPDDCGFVTTDSGKVIWTDVLSFVERLQEYLMSSNSENYKQQLLKLFNSLLHGAALNWWMHEPTPAERFEYRTNDMKIVLHHLEQCFRIDPADASEKFVLGNLFLRDIYKDSSSLMTFVQRKMRYARAAGVLQSSNSNWRGPMQQIWDQLSNEIKKHLRSPNASFFTTLKKKFLEHLKKSRVTLVSEAKTRYDPKSDSSNRKNRKNDRYCENNRSRKDYESSRDRSRGRYRNKERHNRTYSNDYDKRRGHSSGYSNSGRSRNAPSERSYSGKYYDRSRRNHDRDRDRSRDFLRYSLRERFRSHDRRFNRDFDRKNKNWNRHRDRYRDCDRRHNDNDGSRKKKHGSYHAKIESSGSKNTDGYLIINAKRTCHYFHKKFRNRRQMKNHSRQCSFSKAMLQERIKTQSPTELPQRTCGFCHKSFASHNALFRHLEH